MQLNQLILKSFSTLEVTGRPWRISLQLSLGLAFLLVIMASPSNLQAQGVSFVSTANAVQLCSGDAIQAIGQTIITPASAGTILAGSSIFLTFGGGELSGTPVAQGTGAVNITVTLTGNTVTLNFINSVAYAPGDILSITGVLMATTGISANTNISVSFSANSAAPTTNPITFTAPARTIAFMNSCQISHDSGNSQTGIVAQLLAAPLVVVISPCMPGTMMTFAVTSGGGSVTATNVPIDNSCKASSTLRLGERVGTNTVVVRSVLTNSITFTAQANPGPPASMAIISGNNQSGTVGQDLAAPLIVKTVDAYTNPVRGLLLFEVIEGGGALSLYDGLAQPDGLFQTLYRLGNAAGPNVIRVTSPSLPDTQLLFNATGLAAAATTLSLTSGNGQTGQPSQALQPFVVRVSGANNIPIPGAAVTFAVTAGGGSLSVTQATTDATGFASTVLTLGPQQGTNTVSTSSGSLSGSPLAFNALATLSGQAPTLFTGGVVNGASFRPAAAADGNTAPGSIIAIFGAELASGEISAQSTPLPTILGDTTITFNGIAAPLFFVAPGQINAQLPWGVAPGGVAVRVRRGFLEISSQSILVSAVSPGIFTTNRQGTGPGAILHADTFQPVTDANPTAAGQRIAIFATGLGPVQPAATSGQPAPSPAARTISTPLVNINGIPATVEFAGLAPGFVGLYQVNALIPAGISPGNQDLQIIINGVPSNTVTVAVR